MDVDEGSFPAKVGHSFSDGPPGNDIDPCGLFLLLAVLRNIEATGGDGKCGNGSPCLGGSDGWVSCEVPGYFYAVQFFLLSIQSNSIQFNKANSWLIWFWEIWLSRLIRSGFRLPALS